MDEYELIKTSISESIAVKQKMLKCDILIVLVNNLIQFYLSKCLNF